MTFTKRQLQWTTVVAILMVPVGLALWIRGLATEDWATSERRIDTAWTIIPLALLVAIVSGIKAARMPTPEGTRDRTSRWLVATAILIAAGLLYMLTHLGIA